VQQLVGVTGSVVEHLLPPVPARHEVQVTVTVTKLGPQAHPQRSQTRLMRSNKQKNST
jgi:hypothetical protein